MKKKVAKKKTAKKKAVKKAKQTELPNMPKRDKIGKAAKKYLTTREGVTDAKMAFEDAAINLVKLMRAGKRYQIKVDGVIISLRHIEAQDLLKVKKPRE